jgi:hypothetical protein
LGDRAQADGRAWGVGVRAWNASGYG